MKNLFLLGCIILPLISTAQINMNDSTFQVIGYWDKNEKQSYTISEENFKIENGDTLTKELMKYTVDIKVIDSLEESYIVEWKYRNFEVNAADDLLEKVAIASNNMKILVQTDKYGAFEEVTNWKDVKKHISKALKKIQKETSPSPELNFVMEEMTKKYGSKEAIELAAVKDIHQFYSFHGGKYKLKNEVNATIPSINTHGGTPYDTQVKLRLDEISEPNQNCVLRMQRIINSDQLTRSAYEQMTATASTNEVALPSFDKFPRLTNVTYTAARIHNYGWPLFVIETNKVSSQKMIKVQKRTIKIVR